MNLEDHISKIQKNTDNSNDISKRELEFATFCVEILREKNNITSKEAYLLLTKESSVMQDFLLPNYEVLHSQSREYILDEMMKLLQEENRC